MPLVSIVVPVYKVEKYLEKCVDAIISQSLQDIEIILVDDGSQDNSGKICDGYAIKDKRIRVVHQDNQGVSAARNFGIQLAKGKYIGFVDADDWIAPDMFSRLYENAIQNHSHLAFCNYFKVKDNYPIFCEKFQTIDANDPQIKTKLIVGIFSPSESNIMGSCWRMLVCKDLLIQNDIQFDVNTKMTEDMMFVLHCIFCAHGISLEKAPLYYYRMNRNSVTQNYVDHIWENMMIPVSWAKRNMIDSYSDSVVNYAIEADIVNSIAVAIANSCRNGTPMNFWERVEYSQKLERKSFVYEAINKTWKNKDAFQKTVWPQIICIKFHLVWLVVLYHSIKHKTLFFRQGSLWKQT